MFRLINLSFSDHEQSWQNVNQFILIELFYLKEFIEKEGYSEEQIYNVDECGLWWKFPPTRTIKKKSRQTAGFFIHNSLKPHEFRNVKDVTKLPVIWNANKKAWMKASLFEKWFIENFLPSAKANCRRKDIPFKIFLLVDNCTAHSDLSHIDPNVKTMFLPANTTSLIQPMDQGKEERSGGTPDLLFCKRVG